MNTLRLLKVVPFVFFIHASANEVITGKEIIDLGGKGTVSSSSLHAFSLPMKNATKEHRKSFMVGNSLFNQNWVSTPASVKSRQGLGPIFNSMSCSACHFKDGRGRPPLKDDESFSSILVRLSVAGNKQGEAVNEPIYGEQFNPKGIIKVLGEGDVKISYTEILGAFNDGEKYTLLKPSLIFTELRYGEMAKDVMTSLRVAPQVIGLGLLEAISEKDILKQVDELDLNKDGISGKANYVYDREFKKNRLGRFGWKSNQPSIKHQNAGAFNGDMGITSNLFPDQPCTEKQLDCLMAPKLGHAEIDDEDLEHVTTYVKILAVPKRRNVEDVNVLNGQKIFKQMNCTLCHTESYTTGVVKDFPELSKQKIYPYTDLLLHDMGEGLADQRPDGLANGREWRTPPLWGIGLFKTVNGHTRYLHDGRARNLSEAILWHGGEALKAKEMFVSLTKNDREDVIKFLETL